MFHNIAFLLYFAKFVATVKIAFLKQVWVYALFILCGRLLLNHPPFFCDKYRKETRRGELAGLRR